MDSVVHFEIPADDLSRAKKFYGEIFGWQLEEYPEMSYVIARTGEVDEQRMLKKPGRINGGMMKKNNKVSAPSLAIEVENIDHAMEKVKEGGGELLGEKIGVGEMGFMAYFKDTEGNVLSLWETKKKA